MLNKSQKRQGKQSIMDESQKSAKKCNCIGGKGLWIWCGDCIKKSMGDSTIPEKGGCSIGEYTRENQIDVKCAKCNKSFALGEFGILGSDKQVYHSDCLQDKPKSIWKPVSELPNLSNISVYLKMRVPSLLGKDQERVLFGHYDYADGFQIVANLSDDDLRGFYRDWQVAEWVELTDYINHQAELEKRIERLENVIIADKERPMTANLLRQLFEQKGK